MLRYARVLGALGKSTRAPHRLRCALYFPLLGEFREIDMESA